MRKFILIIGILFSFLFIDNVNAQVVNTDFGEVEFSFPLTYYNSSGTAQTRELGINNYLVANNSTNNGVVLVLNVDFSYNNLNDDTFTFMSTTYTYSYDFTNNRWVGISNKTFANKVYYSSSNYINSYNHSTSILNINKLNGDKFSTESIELNSYDTFNVGSSFHKVFTYDNHIFMTYANTSTNNRLYRTITGCNYFFTIGDNSNIRTFCSAGPYTINNYGTIYTDTGASTGITLSSTNASTYTGRYLSNYDLVMRTGTLVANFTIAQNIVPEFSFSTNNNYDSLGTLTSVDVRLNVINYNSNLIYQFQKNVTSGTWTTMQLEEDSDTGDYYFTWLFTENTNLYVRAIDTGGNLVTSSTLEVADINSYEHVSSVIDLGSNHYGYFSNYVLVQNVKSTTENNLVSILCERDRAFENSFCSLYYNDLISNHSNIDYFNDTTFAFHTLFGDANNILVSNKYYVFNFRILKPFVPDISNVVLSTNFGDINLLNNIENVYYNDGGSYTDYAIVFNTNNISLDSSYNLNSISVYFNIPLGNYYYNNIPDSFTFSIYRAFKLSYYDELPSTSEISNLFSINNLSSIDGVNSQNLFFTDNTFNTYGFGGIISAPFRLLYALEDYDTCSDINIPFPHSNQTLTLKCVRSSIPTGINPLISILQIILSGLICYRVAVSTLALIKQVINPNDTGIEVLDL